MLNAKERLNEAPKKRKRAASGRPSTLDRSIIHLLHRASQRATEIFALETRTFDITARQYAVLTAVAQHEGLSQTDLVRLTGIDRSTLADVVQRLLRRGIIEREKTTRDGRTYAVSLTARGHEILETLKPHARRADRAVLSCLGDRDGKLTTQILSRLLKQRDAESAPAGS
jgi:DNA-binding MarR family transcriptional regulator